MIRSNNVSIAKQVHAQIAASDDSIWRLSDFKNMPMMAVAQALSRLSK